MDQSGCEKAFQLVTAWWQFKNHSVYKRGFNRQSIGNGYSVLARQQNLKRFPALVTTDQADHGDQGDEGDQGDQGNQGDEGY